MLPLLLLLSPLEIGASGLVGALKLWNKKFEPTKTDLDWLCKNEEELNKFLKDPLRGEFISAGLFRELLNGMSYSNNIENINRMRKDLPILLL